MAIAPHGLKYFNDVLEIAMNSILPLKRIMSM